MKRSAFLTAIGLATFVVTSSIAVIPPAQAQRSEDCRDRIRGAERHLDHMINRFGRHSWQARDARRDLERARDWCDSHRRRDWDGDRRGDRHDDHRRHDGWGR